jgi:hypothetical protein
MWSPTQHYTKPKMNLPFLFGGKQKYFWFVFFSFESYIAFCIYFKAKQFFSAKRQIQMYNDYSLMVIFSTLLIHI